MDNSEVVDVLNDLIETSKDGEYGFTTCAERATSGQHQRDAAEAQVARQPPGRVGVRRRRGEG